jgi:hypothetical protein
MLTRPCFAGCTACFGVLQESTSGQGSGSKGSSTGFAKPGNPNVCDDIQPNQQYTCQQQVHFWLWH